MADVKLLLPKVQKLCEAFVKKCADNSIQVAITQTYRSVIEQDALYAQGRTKAGRIVTNAKGGQSMHNFRCAFDFVILEKGKPDWNITNKKWQQAGKIAQSVGLTWGGSWSSFVDMPHCEYTANYRLADFQKGIVDKNKFA